MELDANLSHTVNYDSFLPLVRICKEAGVRRFIFASSGSVYGVSDSPNVTEEHPLVPISLYNKYKAMCEKVAAAGADRGLRAGHRAARRRSAAIRPGSGWT